MSPIPNESRWMGLKMNIAKTKVTVVDNTPINVNKKKMSKATCTWDNTTCSLKEKNQDTEIQRRIMADWAAYAKHILNIMTCSYVVVRYLSCQYFANTYV